MLNDNETTKPTHHPKIMIADVREYDYEKAKEDEEILLELSYTYDDMAIVKKMKEIVPEYKSQHSKFEKLDKWSRRYEYSWRLNKHLALRETDSLRAKCLFCAIS